MEQDSSQRVWDTKRVTVPRDSFHPEDLDEAARWLNRGELVAFPTETVYGLGGNALDADASRKIYAAKGRPSDNPLIVHIASLEALGELAEDVPEAAYRLAEAFWPGPMTMILKKKPCVPDSTTGGLDTVAIRFPSHPVAQELIRRSGVYIAAPSANLSGRPSPTTAEHVWEDMKGRIPMILDGGPSEIGLESSIIDLSGTVPTILRPGYVTKEDMERVLKEVRLDRSLKPGENAEVKVAKAPGMKYRHYAPKADLSVVEGPQEEVFATILRLAKEQMEQGKRVAVLATEESREKYPGLNVYIVGKRSEEITIASGLFAALRRLDEEQIEVAYSEGFAEEGVGCAIMNRLLKAAGHHVIETFTIGKDPQEEER